MKKKEPAPKKERESLSFDGVETSYFSVTPCWDCSVPGYLIVFARNPGEKLADYTLAAQAALGTILAICEQAIVSVIRPERVYIARFSEKTAGIHFHVFPRSCILAQAYRRAFPHKREIDGPELLSWARRKFRTATLTYPTETVQVLTMIQTLLGTKHGDHHTAQAAVRIRPTEPHPKIRPRATRVADRIH